jgi:drug/metabolite transporter (DMT)-like permease
MVPLFAALLGLVLFAQVPNAVQSIGISLVSGGLIALSIDRIRSRIDWRLAAAAASAGMAVAGYSVIDAYGTRLNGDWIGFTAWLVIADTLTFLAVAASLRGKALWLELATMKLRIVGSGLLGVASFSVFLWALSQNPVGIVVALREVSLLFSVLFGVILHGERLSALRASAALLICCGLLLATR